MGLSESIRKRAGMKENKEDREVLDNRLKGEK